jgi:hypothetical protein
MTFRERVRGWLPVIIAGGVLVAGGLAAIPLGGWDTVELVSDEIPEQPIGQPYVGQQWTISVDDVYLTDVHPDGYTELEPGQALLVVVATLEDMRAEPQYPISSSSFYPVTIPGVLTLGEYLSISDYSVFLARDGSFNPYLSPGIPDTLQYVFLVDEGDFAEGDEIRIALIDATPEEADIIEGTRWVDVHVAAEVVVPLRDER